MNKQIENFQNVTIPELEKQLGDKSGKSVANYLFVVGSGGNDYTFNYFLSKDSSNVSLEAFTTKLTSTLSYQLKVPSGSSLMVWHVY